MHCIVETRQRRGRGTGRGRGRDRGRLAERFLVVRFSGLFFCRFQFN